MPGIPLLNLGYGLGGLSQGYNQAVDQGLQNSIRRLALQQAQSQSNAQTLAGLALQAGLLNNPNAQNPISPISNTQGGPQASGAPAVPQPPAGPSGLPSGQQPYVISNTPVPGFPGAVIPPVPATAGGSTTPPGSNDNGGGGGGGGFDASGFISGLPVGGADSATTLANRVLNAARPGSTTPTPTPAPSPAPAPPASTDVSTTPATSGNVAAVFPNGESIDISSMYRQIDYQKLSQGIARLAPPGTSQADIYAAVLDLGKLAEGDKVQQQQAGLLARALLGGQFKLAGIGMQQTGATERTGMTTTAAGQRTAAQQSGATERTRLQIESREQIAAASQQIRRLALNVRSANDQARLDQSAQRLQIATQNAGRAELAQQINAIRARMATIKPVTDRSGNTTYTDAQRQQLQAFSDQIANIAAQAAAAPAADSASP